MWKFFACVIFATVLHKQDSLPVCHITVTETNVFQTYTNTSLSFLATSGYFIKADTNIYCINMCECMNAHISWFSPRHVFFSDTRMSEAQLSSYIARFIVFHVPSLSRALSRRSTWFSGKNILFASHKLDDLVKSKNDASKLEFLNRMCFILNYIIFITS